MKNYIPKRPEIHEIPAWVESFFDRLHVPEQKIIAGRLKECSEAMRAVYDEIDKKLPAYQIDIYETLGKKISHREYPTKADVLAAIECTYLDITETLGPIGEREFFHYLENMYNEFKEAAPLFLSRIGNLKYLKGNFPQVTENPDRDIGREAVLSAIIDAGVFCSPTKLMVSSIKGIKAPSIRFLSSKEIREEVKKANSIWDEISLTTKQLISLIKERRKILERGYVEDNANLDIIDLINNAAQNGNKEERKYSIIDRKPHMDRLQHYDCDDYPSFLQILEAAASEVDENPAILSAAWREVIITQQASNSDFSRFFLRCIEESKCCRHIPHNFSLKNSTIALITEVALDLDDGDYSEESIKKIKRKLRGKTFQIKS